MVANVRHEVGVATIRLDDGAVLVVHEAGRGKIRGSRVFVKVRLQEFEGLLDVPAFADVRLVGNLVEMDAEGIEVLTDFREFGIDAVTDEERVGFLVFLEVFVPELLLDVLRDVDEVDAMVIVIPEDGSFLAEELAIADIEGMAEMLDLVPAVIHVIFAGDVVSPSIEEIRDAIADCSAPRMPKVQVAGRVGRNVFDVDLDSFPRRTPIGFLLAEDRLDDPLEGILFKEEIEESRARDLDFFEEGGGEFWQKALGKVKGLSAGKLAEAHRGIRGIVAVGGVAGMLDDDQRGIDFKADRFRRVEDDGTEFFFVGHKDVLSKSRVAVARIAFFSPIASSPSFVMS